LLRHAHRFRASIAFVQVLMPNISFWGHLSGLLVGVLLISRVGAGLFMPSYGKRRYCPVFPFYQLQVFKIGLGSVLIFA